MLYGYADIVNKEGKSNKISTTKYSLLSWLPVSLFEQFRRVANVYFLVIAGLMVSIYPSHPWVAEIVYVHM